MLIMDHQQIRGEELPSHAYNSTCNLLHAYIYAHIQRLIDEYPGYGVQATTRLKSQCANMTFSDQIIYNRVFQKVIHKGGSKKSIISRYSKILRLWKFQW